MFSDCLIDSRSHGKGSLISTQSRWTPQLYWAKKPGSPGNAWWTIRNTTSQRKGKNHIWGLFYVSIGSPRELCDYKERKWRLGIKIDSIYFLDTHSLIHIMLRTISQIHTLGFTENKLSVNSNENGEEFWSRILVMVPLMILVLLRSKYLEKTNSFCWQLMTVSDFNKSMFKTNLVKNVYKDFYKRHKCNPITGSNYILNIRTICLRPHWLHW